MGLGRLARIIAVAMMVLSIGFIAARYVNTSQPILIVGALLGPGMFIISTTAAIVVGRRLPMRIRFALALLGTMVLAVVVVGPSRSQAICRVEANSAAGTGTYTVYSHNVLWRRGDPAVVAQQIMEAEADLVLLQEAESAFVAELVAELGDQFPYVIEAESDETLSLATLSRLPIADVIDTGVTRRANSNADSDADSDAEPENPMLIFTVETPAGPTRVANVHLTAPVTQDRAKQRQRELETLAKMGDELTMIIGDFNASTAHKPFRDLLGDVGYGDAHAELGCDFGATWTPFVSAPGFAQIDLLHLDHVLIKPPLAPTSYVEAGRAGSDHRGIVVGLTEASDLDAD
ncbi:MAG: endonuclease/exonuclease/phosphatase family protein [Acidimicrobiales bacterium]